MRVSLIDYTGNGHPNPWHAVNLLIFTKHTRLTMSPGLLNEIAAWPESKKLEELEYMANTIPSSWEFVDYTFLVEGVTRAFTHQFVRSRHFSFAQQSMRVLDVSSGPGWDYLTGPSIEKDPDRKGNYERIMKDVAYVYHWLIQKGAKVEDARGVLPTNILTNIVGKCNMRTFVELVRKRSSPRTQNEYRTVLTAMKEAVRAVHPWIDLFIARDVDKAIDDLQTNLAELREQGMSEKRHTQMTKLLDQLRAQL
jgi:flavin-dependent thymidylate synthase